MSRLPETPQSSIDNMCRAFRSESTLSPRSIRSYREACIVVLKSLESGGRHTMPWEITREDVRWLLDNWIERGLAISTRRSYMSALRTWTTYYGNDVVVKMKIRWPADARPNVDWLTQDQARQLLSLEMTPTQELIVHCELCLGMRRVEVQRLNTGSFRQSYVEIIGKGPQGGKPRYMPYHRETARVLSRYNDYRDAMIQMAKARRPSVQVPDTLLIYAKGSRIYEYAAKGSGIDEMLKGLGREIGVKFSNHTLRRTFGREMYRSGIPPATISKMMGHESIDMTLRYIGVDLDDMTGAMAAFAL